MLTNKFIYIGIVAVLLLLSFVASPLFREQSIHTVQATTATQNSLDLSWAHLSTTTGDLPVPGKSTQQTASLLLDIDNDGIQDLVIGSRQGPGASLVWYQRTESGWQLWPIDSTVLDIEAGGAFDDIDQDGDLDIVMGGDFQSNQVWWWENPYPNFAPGQDWTRREIKNSGANKHHDQMFGDFDGDGQSELVFWNQNARTLFLAEIPSAPRNAATWPLTEVYRWDGGLEHEGLDQADIDGDGLVDIVGGGRWYKYNGDGTFTVNVIDDQQRFTRAAAAQLLPGGRPEVVFVVGDGDGPLRWYEWDGGTWVGHQLLDSVNHGHSLDIVDVNQDGNLDIFVAEMRLNGGNWQSKMLFLLGDGTGNFAQDDVASGYGNHESRVGDLDGDGDLDILGKPYNWETPRLDIWLNDLSVNDPGDPEPTARWCRRVVDESRPWRGIFVTSADIDGDAYEDIVTGGWWYQNPGTTDGAWVRREIGAPLNNYAAVYDFDGDGDLDILGTTGQDAQSSSTFVWARNNGSGTFTILDNIEQAQGDFLQGVAVAQLQEESQLSVALSWHAANQGIQTLTVPADPSTQPWAWQQISPTSQDEALSAGDIDRDGDVDLLLGTQWLRNDGTTWSAFSLFQPEGMPDRNRLVDINGDGRLDSVVGYEAISVPGKLAWYEQPASATGLWTEHLIANVVGPMSMDAVDMDGDGDTDVVVGEHNLNDPASASLYIFENADGTGAEWTEHTVYTGDEHHDGAHVTDIDSDGDYDIVSIGWGHSQVVLYEYRTSDCDEPEEAPTTVPTTVPPTAAPTLTPTATLTLTPTLTPSETLTPSTYLPVVTNEPTPTPTGQTIEPTSSVNPTEAPTPTAMSTEVAVPTPGPQGACTEDGLQVLYTFQEGSGSMIHDVSGHNEPLDLTIAGSGVRWLPDGGISIETPANIVAAESPTRLIEAIKTSNELSVDVWLKPANLTQDGPARIVTISRSPMERNFTLGQGKFGNHPTDVFDVRLRTTDASINNNGEPSLTTASGTVRNELMHVVYTRSADGEVRMYVDGDEVLRSITPGSLTNWDAEHSLALANEIGGERPWLGELHRVALYDCAMGVLDAAMNSVGEP